MSKTWTIVGYQKEIKNKEGVPTFIDIARIKVYDFDTEAEALEAAKKLIKRKGYRLEEVSEYVSNEEVKKDKVNKVLDKILKMK